MMEVRSASRDSVASVAKALDLLTFVGEHGPVGLAEIERALGMPKSTLFRLLATLCRSGFLERTGQAQYAVTVKLWRLGSSAIDYSAVRRDVAVALRDLVDRCSETAHYSVYEDGHAVYVDKLDGVHPIRAYTEVGGRSPAYASATGKALLAYCPAEEIDRVAKSAEQHTGATLRRVDAIRLEFATVREQGYAVNRGEWRTDVWGVAAPVFGAEMNVAGALGVSGPRDRIEPQVSTLSALVVENANWLTERRGGNATLRRSGTR